MKRITFDVDGVEIVVSRDNDLGVIQLQIIGSGVCLDQVSP